MNGLTPPLVGWNNNKKKHVLSTFLPVKFPACQVKVQIALKFSKLSIFFLKFPRDSKILFDV